MKGMKTSKFFFFFWRLYNFKLFFFCSILQWAIRNGDFKIITTLLKFLDRCNIEDLLQYQNLKKETALHVTCVHDKPEFIRALINLGADPNIPDKNGNTPLHVSVELGFLMCATKIMEKANYTTEKSKELKIDLINDQGMTPLHLAVRKNNLNMVKKLLDNGSSVKLAESKHGYNVLHIAVEEVKYYTFLIFFLFIFIIFVSIESKRHCFIFTGKYFYKS